MKSPTAALLCILLASCASAPQNPLPSSAAPARVLEDESGASLRLSPETSTSESVLAAPVERVWALLPSTYETLGIPAQPLDAASHTYGTRKFTGSRIGGKRASEYIRCGNEGAGPSATSALRMQLAVATSVQAAAPGRTVLRTQITGSATPVDGSSTGVLLCASRGNLEEQIAALLAQRLAA